MGLSALFVDSSCLSRDKKARSDVIRGNPLLINKIWCLRKPDNELTRAWTSRVNYAPCPRLRFTRLALPFRAEQLASSACEHCREHRHESPSPTLAIGVHSNRTWSSPNPSPLSMQIIALQMRQGRDPSPRQMRDDDECVRILASRSSDRKLTDAQDF